MKELYDSIRPLSVEESSEALKLFDKEYEADTLSEQPEYLKKYVDSRERINAKQLKRIEKGKLQGYGMFLDNELIATCFIKQPNIIRKVAVESNYRNQGIGTMMMDYVEKLILESGQPSSVLLASCKYQDFYLKRGYDLVIDDKQHDYPLVAMEKQLNYKNIELYKGKEALCLEQ